MFDKKRTKEAVDRFIEEHYPQQRGAESREEHIDQIINDEKYATMLKMKGLLTIFATIVPQTALYIAAGALLGAPAWLLVPTILYAAVYPVAMGRGHPIYHVSETEAREAGSAIMNALRRTRYMAYSARNHFMHHKYPDTNFNLSYPGADALLGQLLQPNLEDLFRMADDDTLHF
jgi:fatty acid desaturase